MPGQCNHLQGTKSEEDTEVHKVVCSAMPQLHVVVSGKWGVEESRVTISN